VRTTLTLDEDVASRLKAEVRKTGQSFKQAVNEHLRASLSRRGERRRPGPFKVRSRPMKPEPGISFDSISQLLEEVEGPFHR
jgi:hypothetical protein